MRNFAIGLMVCGALLSACGTQQPPPPPLSVATQAPIVAEDKTPAPLTGEQLLAQQPAEVQAAIGAHQPDTNWPVYRTAVRVLYPYAEAAEPVVDCAPLRTTDLQLQAGETITDVALGDSERWMATPAASGDPRNAVPHLAVKPQLAGLETNLTIYTTKHIYHLLLRARGHALREVEFYYPDELLTAMKEADAAAKQTADPPGDSSARIAGVKVNSAQLNFAYTIAGMDTPWRPIRAFDDGSHVYVQMPSGMKSSEAPALLINAGSGTQMANYRVAGNYYVVDRLFSDAVLVAGVGREQDRVTISYTGGGR
jgi:P-type conjugative transfer protein TrbG